MGVPLRDWIKINLRIDALEKRFGTDMGLGWKTIKVTLT